MRRVFGFAIVMLATLVPAAAARGAEDRWPPWLAECPDLAPGARCGSYAVFEDRAVAGSAKIDLFVAVLPATGPGPYDAPIVPLAGGPGQAASDAAGIVTAMFGPLRESCDIVFIDQRGTGRSNKLDCGPWPPGTPLQVMLDPFPSRSFVRRCLEAQSADVTKYTTDLAVEDLEEIRAAIGYDRWNLFGASYGTRVALHYLRRFPGRVRSAVLDGVSPPHTESLAPFADAFERTLVHLFERCAADPACSAAHPRLASDWTAALARFDQGFVETTVHHPESGDEQAVHLERGVFADVVRRMTYQAQGWSNVAATIHAAAAGDFQRIVEARYAMQNATLRGLSLGMLLTISCTESVPLMSQKEAERVGAGTALGNHRALTIRKACGEWRAGVRPRGWSKPVVSNVPVLILSGAVDPATPPWVAAEVAKHLSNSRHLVIPNRAHGPTDRACENSVVQAFLAAGSAAGLSTECIAATPWPGFKPLTAPVTEVAVDPERLARYVGSYELMPGFVLVVTLESGRLMIEPPGEPKHALTPVGVSRFFVAAIGEHITFTENDAGAVRGFAIENGPKATKVE